MTTNKQTNKTKQKKIRRGYNSVKTGDHQNLSKSPSSHLPISSKHHPFEENAKKLEEPTTQKTQEKKPKTSSAAGAAEITTHFPLATDYHSCNNNNNNKKYQLSRKSPCLHPFFGPCFHPLCPLSEVSGKVGKFY
jgi:hypothetical protein